MKNWSRRKVIGWCALVPRLMVMIAALISCYCSWITNLTIGKVSSIFLIVIYLWDIIYLSLVIIHDIIKRTDEWSNRTYEEMDEMVECEQELFETHKEEDKEDD